MKGAFNMGCIQTEIDCNSRMMDYFSTEEGFEVLEMLNRLNRIGAGISALDLSGQQDPGDGGSTLPLPGLRNSCRNRNRSGAQS